MMSSGFGSPDISEPEPISTNASYYFSDPNWTRRSEHAPHLHSRRYNARRKRRGQNNMVRATARPDVEMRGAFTLSVREKAACYWRTPKGTKKQRGTMDTKSVSAILVTQWD